LNLPKILKAWKIMMYIYSMKNTYMSYFLAFQKWLLTYWHLYCILPHTDIEHTSSSQNEEFQIIYTTRYEGDMGNTKS
jgi:hypothetical protein